MISSVLLQSGVYALYLFVHMSILCYTCNEIRKTLRYNRHITPLALSNDWNYSSHICTFLGIGVCTCMCVLCVLSCLVQLTKFCDPVVRFLSRGCKVPQIVKLMLMFQYNFQFSFIA